jgi:hypothetical protein
MQHRQLIMAKKDSQKGAGMVPITFDEAKKYNEAGYGIFKSVNSFYGERRIISNLVSIVGWPVEMDEETKESQWVRILASPLKPSIIIETKRGYQLIFLAKDGKVDGYKGITRDRLVYFFNGDPNACDACRVLRVPGFYHLKDPSDPFLVCDIANEPIYYSEKEMREAFPLDPKLNQMAHASVNRSAITKSKLKWNMSQSDALLALSGKPEVKGEELSFRSNCGGTMQIVVNGTPTSCWIDQEGFIGSSDKGGPTVLQWLLWYHKDWTSTSGVKVLKKYGII